ncbi:MAG: NAD(P)H-dependent oxidoreductase subunit E [Gammaproteobacteria bacterium]|nr:NAD(P)H-dependent oxidoreductase subunit E [Gammaproteobacteria bacterium]
MSIKYPYNPTNHLLHVLFEEQQRAHFISNNAIQNISKSLNLPHAQVEGVVEFYAFFHREPRGQFDILFSNCTSCGDAWLRQRLCDKLNVKLGETRSDGLVSIDQTSCIGMCDHGASLLLNNSLTITSLTAKRIDQIVKLVESSTALQEWPKHWFDISDNVHKRGLLLTEPFQPGSALKVMIEHNPPEILNEIIVSGLKGRGGAGFSTGLKWKLCREAIGDAHYVICNADEGEPGTFKDRVLLNSYADLVFEGMTICAYVIGAKQGFLYLRGEYRYLLDTLNATLQKRRETGLLGGNILGQGFDFDISIIVGAGAYICGEESALIESLEEKRGIPRIRPPFPVTQGYKEQPTVVNNVETLATVAKIVLHGHHWFESHGTNRSKGSKLLSVSGNCARPGIYEYDFGVSLQEVLNDVGAENVQAVQVGGPSGRLLGPDHFNHLISFEGLSTGGSLMIFAKHRDILALIHNFSHFFAHESCGFCTPCRVGTRLLENSMSKLCNGHSTAYDIDEIKHISALVSQYSHCGLGVSAAHPILDGLKYFQKSFEEKILKKEMEPEFDLDSELSEARAITDRDDPGAHL